VCQLHQSSTEQALHRGNRVSTKNPTCSWFPYPWFSVILLCPSHRCLCFPALFFLILLFPLCLSSSRTYILPVVLRNVLRAIRMTQGFTRLSLLTLGGWIIPCCREAVLCILRCLAASLTSTQQISGALPLLLVTYKNVQIAKCPIYRSKISPVLRIPRTVVSASTP